MTLIKSLSTDFRILWMKLLFSFSVFLSACFTASTLSAQQVITGAERLSEYLPLLEGKRVGLVVNHTSILGEQQTHLLDTLLTSGVDVKAVFAPEHGFRGNADAGETIRDGKDTRTGTPIISLYGNNKKPTARQMDLVDILIFDIQDVGARFYTYISTMYYVMEACVETRKKLIVLDRPNPCDYIQGPVLKPAYRSFVGIVPIPVLHGCTVGELARMFNGEGWISPTKNGCDLTVIPLQGWVHRQAYSLPVKPSPNLPNDQSIRLYPSLCLFEATRVSVGRGTTFPFQVLGVPDKKYGDFSFTPRSLPGFDKNPMHKDQVCYGIDLREEDFSTGFTLRYFMDFYQRSGEGAKFFSRANWFDLLMGTDQVRKEILAGKTEKEIIESWQEELDAYKHIRAAYMLYR